MDDDENDDNVIIHKDDDDQTDEEIAVPSQLNLYSSTDGALEQESTPLTSALDSLSTTTPTATKKQRYLSQRMCYLVGIGLMLSFARIYLVNNKVQLGQQYSAAHTQVLHDNIRETAKTGGDGNNMSPSKLHHANVTSSTASADVIKTNRKSRPQIDTLQWQNQSSIKKSQQDESSSKGVDLVSEEPQATEKKETQTSDEDADLSMYEYKLPFTPKQAFPSTPMSQELKNWTRIFLENRPFPPDTPGAFVHVGKTAGSTLSMELRMGCHSWVRQPCNQRAFNETMVSKLTTYIHVPDFHLLKEKDSYQRFGFYLFTLRDPLERSLSSLTYMHPLNKLVPPRPLQRFTPYFQCFRTMDEMTNYLSDDLEEIYNDQEEHPYYDPQQALNNATSCKDVVRAMIMGSIPDVDHFYWNTQHIASQISNWDQDPAILSVRTENLSGDWQSANDWLGHETPALLEKKNKIRVFTEEQYIVNKTISASGQTRLCKHLLREYQIFLALVQKSANLSEDEKNASLELGRRNCPGLNLKFPMTQQDR